MTTETRKTGETLQLGRFAQDLEFGDIPPEAITMAKWLTLNILGCAAYGATLDSTALARRVHAAMGGGADATVIGTTLKLPVASAAGLNAQACYTLNHCDTHIEGVFHPGHTIIAAALAVAEQRRASGAEFLTAVVAAYEVGCRAACGLTQTPETHHSVVGFIGSIADSVAAAVAAGKALGLDEEQFCNAIAVGATSATGVGGANDGYGWDVAKATYQGVLGAYLAREGMIMGPAPLEGERGYVVRYTGGTTPPQKAFDRLVRGLGSEWETLNIEIKTRSSSAMSISQIEAAQKAVLDNGIDYRQIERIVVKIPPKLGTGRPTLLGRTRGERTGYRWETAYAIAIAIIDGTTLTTANDMHNNLDNPLVLELEQKVTFENNLDIDPHAMHFYPALAVVETTDGQTYEAYLESPRGKFPEYPLTDDEMTSKFQSNAGVTFDEQRQAEILSAVENLDQMNDISELAALLRGDSP